MAGAMAATRTTATRVEAGTDTAAKTTTAATISPGVAATTTRGSTDVTAYLDQSITAAATRLPGNQNALQEELPEGGTHIHLGDVSCKSLVVALAGGLSKLALPLALMGVAHEQIRQRTRHPASSGASHTCRQVLPNE